MVSIVNFFTQQSRTITKIVDTTFFRLQESTAALDQLIPLKSYADRDLLLFRIKGKPTAASVIAEDQEVPVTRPRAILSEDVLGNLKLGKQYVFTARDFEMMRKIELLGYSGGNGSIVAELTKRFYGVAADMTPAIVDKHTYLTLKVACTGQCVYTDPLSGAQIQLTYPNTIAALLPAALTGNARWAQAATANGLGNLQTHAEENYNQFGSFPYALLMHWKNLREIGDQTTTRTAFIAGSGLALDATNLSGLYLNDDAIVNLIKQRTRCQQVILVDGRFEEEQPGTAAPVETPYLADDYYAFVAQGNMERALVPTIEKDFFPGIYINAKVLEEIPRRERIAAVANGIPFVADDRMIAARKVN